ncbi:MAG: hypothetical protein ACRDSP_05520 [Pseudonocardiaceae bacterium]
MDHRDLVVAGVAALVTVVSWSAAISYDAGQREADSHSQGQLWAQLNQPTAAECKDEMLRISGPQISGVAWLDGCLTGVNP